MTADEWYAAQLTLPGQRSTEDMVKRAWAAALHEAARIAESNAQRYTCDKMRGVCNGIGHAIRQSAEGQK